jgi:toxin ParE1/3/4
MAFQIMWTAPAIEDLKGIVEYLVEHDPPAAQRFEQELTAKIDLLATQPYMGSRLAIAKNSTRREILVRPYRIFYRVLEEIRRIEIQHVRHSARELDV